MTQLINLTPHTLNIKNENGVFITIYSSGIARVSVSKNELMSINGIPIYSTSYGDITGLPEKKDDTLYITSLFVANRAGRSDVMSPGELIRDDNGKPIGCKGLTLF